ncbi:hypothetical protein EE612_031142, partial [Oryza sativa]
TVVLPSFSLLHLFFWTTVWSTTPAPVPVPLSILPLPPMEGRAVGIAIATALPRRFLTTQPFSAHSQRCRRLR